MTYYTSSHGHNQSVINGIGRIGQMWGGKSALWNDETMADEFVKQARKYIAARKEGPAVLPLLSASRTSTCRGRRTRASRASRSSTYRGDAMVQLDWCAGEILKALDEHGLADNTIVIFSSDNGPVYDDGYEDGTTVHTSTKEVDRGHDGSGPYPRRQVPDLRGRHARAVHRPLAGQGRSRASRAAMVNQIDFIASFADAARDRTRRRPGDRQPQHACGPARQDRKGQTLMIEEAGGIALRRGPWKYIAGNKGKKQAGAELYNLDSDTGEQHNLAEQKPEIAAEMNTILQRFIGAKAGIRSLE